MADWDKINAEKHKDILIGRCENQALELLRDYNFNETDIQEQYKELVKLMYRLNTEVEAELNKNEQNTAQ